MLRQMFSQGSQQLAAGRADSHVCQAKCLSMQSDGNWLPEGQHRSSQTDSGF